jgi:hypothetical protein
MSCAQGMSAAETDPGACWRAECADSGLRNEINKSKKGTSERGDAL